MKSEILIVMKHNGWTNYATWRVNLEIIDNIDTDFWTDTIEDQRGSDMLHYNLGEEIREYTEQLLEGGGCDNNLTLSYALAFLSDVNWREIAEHIIDTYKENYWCINCNRRLEERYSVHYCCKECKEEDELLATHPKG